MKKLDFNVPFSGFAAATFINCFTSLYMYVDRIETNASGDYECAKRDTGVCTNCGNCRKTPAGVQEVYFFYFDTVCGHSSLRFRYDGEPTDPQKLICETDLYDGGTDDNVDFLFGYVGYDYRKLTDPSEFEAAVKASIDVGMPLIVKLKEGSGRFRVISGYNGGALVCPDFTNAQNKPDRAPEYAELETVYVITGKNEPRYTFKDALMRIKGVMEYNKANDLWGTYMEKVGMYTADSFQNTDAAEKKKRMKRVAETMWPLFNCHNFAEVFRYRYMDVLKNPAFDPMCAVIGPSYGYTHDLAWALICLEECADFTKYSSVYMGEMIELTFTRMAMNDDDVLKAVNDMLAVI